MPTYKVECDTCQNEFEGRSFDIDSIITDRCEFCGGDMCSNCVKNEWHKDCDSEYVESEES